MRAISAGRDASKSCKQEFRRTDISEAALPDDFSSGEEVLYDIGKILATFLSIAALAHLVVTVIELAPS